MESLSERDNGIIIEEVFAAVNGLLLPSLLYLKLKVFHYSRACVLLNLLLQAVNVYLTEFAIFYCF
jgi:hypothetical protein